MVVIFPNRNEFCRSVVQILVTYGNVKTHGQGSVIMRRPNAEFVLAENIILKSVEEIEMFHGLRNNTIKF